MRPSIRSDGPNSNLTHSTSGTQGRHVDKPEPELAGDVVTRWLYDLHMAHVGGLPYRLLVCAMGLVVAALSVTGLVIWWRKRRAQRSRTAARCRSSKLQ